MIREPVVAERSAPSMPPSRETNNTARAEYVEQKEPPTTAAPSPLKRIEVRIPDSRSNVVVQVQEQKGGVQVTVRTDDARTAGDIAAHLPELQRDLGQQGFRAAAWTSDAVGDGARHEVRSASGSDAPDNADTGGGERSQNKRDWETDSEQRRRKAPQQDFEEELW
jgi:hypothetical protein